MSNWGRVHGLFLFFAGFILVVSFIEPVLAACTGSNTYIVRIVDPLNNTIKSSATQTISILNSDVGSCGTEADSTTLSAYCQMQGNYRGWAQCVSCTSSDINGAVHTHASPANITILTCHSPEDKKFILRNQSGNAIAAFDSKGYLYLRGFNYSGRGPLNPPPDSFIIRNNTGNPVAYIDSNGNINVTGRIFISQTAGEPPKNSFIIRNGTQRHVAFIDSHGRVNLTGKIYFNWTGEI